MDAYEYHKVPLEDIERRASEFCGHRGDGAHGELSDVEYNRLYDHLAEVLRSHGTFLEGWGDADFKGSDYGDQIPWISIVPRKASPTTALKAGLAATASSHRPLAVSFDFYPDGVLILPSNHVYTTFAENEFEPKS